MVPHLLDGLNPAQREAVLHGEGPLLVVAGAGSGKTRVLTHRIARLIEQDNVSPFEILAITFTNKAAEEMRNRVGSLVGPVAQKMWVSTFHSACVRILRRDGSRLGYPSSFTIYDQADSTRLVGYVLRDLNIDTKRLPARSVQGQISLAKNELRTPEQMDAACQRFAHRIPLLANMVEGGKTPIQSAQELQQRGFRIAIFPGGTARAVAHTLQSYYASLHTHQTTAPFKDQMLDFDGLNTLIGTPELMAQGRRYENPSV